jgi:hypothetical protein
MNTGSFNNAFLIIDIIGCLFYFIMYLTTRKSIMKTIFILTIPVCLILGTLGGFGFISNGFELHSFNTFEFLSCTAIWFGASLIYNLYASVLCMIFE